jgi:VanZ family protein
MIGMKTRSNDLRSLWRFLPAVAYYGFIFYLSSRSSFPIEAPFSGFDKVAHVGIYGVFGILLARGFAEPGNATRARRLALAFFLGVLGGVLDEVHQIFVPARNADIWDAVADAIGTAAGVILYARCRRKREKPNAAGKTSRN